MAKLTADLTALQNQVELIANQPEANFTPRPEITGADQREPYYCPANVLTVGIGSTEASGQKIELNRKYSDQEIAERWANDIRLAENCVNRYGYGRNMPQGAFDAMVSLTFNVGCGAMQKSTLFRLAQTKYSPEMCEQFPRWNKADGKVLKGLTIRREKERALCLAK
ncbi:glycoside hydrolase [Ursidibacter arcticus]|nr:glycoside hydrolase [Ursidibacter arcticus]